MAFVKDQCSHLVYPNIMHSVRTCENLDSIGHRSCKRIINEKTLLLHKFVCFHMAKKY